MKSDVEKEYWKPAVSQTLGAESPLNRWTGYTKPGVGTNNGVGQAIGRPCPDEPPTLRAEAEERVGIHRREAEKADEAVAFFRENPAFDLFVRLIRKGVINL